MHEVKAAVDSAKVARAENRQDVKDIHKKIDLFHTHVSDNFITPLNKNKTDLKWVIGIGGFLLTVAGGLILFLYGHSEDAHTKIGSVKERVNTNGANLQVIQTQNQYIQRDVAEAKEDTKYLIKYLKGETNGNYFNIRFQ